MMEWIQHNMALVIAVVLPILSLVIYFTGGNRNDLWMHIGFAVIGLLFFLLWIGQRRKG